MAVDRPKRRLSDMTVEAHDYDKWTVEEVRRFQKALLKFSPSQPDKIARFIGSKTAREVRAYLKILEKKIQDEQERKPKQSAELWTALASDLVSCEVKDYSEVLAEVMSIAGQLENPTNASEGSPDYSAIYRYIAAILAGEELPFLGQLECSIVLDMMHSLIDTLRTSDTSKQEELMLRKYHLLNSKIDLKDQMKHLVRCRKAINNDFSDFDNAAVTQKEGNPNCNRLIQTAIKSSNLPPAVQDKKSLSSSAQKYSNTTGKRSSDFESYPLKSAKKSRKEEENAKGESSKNSQEQDQGQTPQKRGRPPKDAGKNNDSTLQTPSKKQSPGSSKDQAATGSDAKDKNTDQSNESTQNEEKIPKKPGLFTLNPFCIPIDLLKFQSIVSSQVVFKPKVVSKVQKVDGPGYDKKKHFPAPREELRWRIRHDGTFEEQTSPPK